MKKEIKMTDDMKIKLFEKMLWLEHMSELYCDGKLYDKVDYWSECNGAFRMLEVIGLNTEYIYWAIGK